MRKVEDADLVGKTIKSIDSSAVNTLKIVFSDDTAVNLTAEDALFTQFGTIPGIFIEDNYSLEND